jgi:hypothetical protein
MSEGEPILPFGSFGQAVILMESIAVVKAIAEKTTRKECGR